MSHLKIFVGHKRPSFTWRGFEYIGDFSVNPEVDSSLSVFHSDTCGEYLSLFRLRRYLESVNTLPDVVTICQYRRFLVNTNIGKPFSNAPYCNQIEPVVIESAAEDFAFLTMPTQGEWLIGKTLLLQNGIVGNYSQAHILRDLLRLISDSVDEGLMSNQVAIDFMLSNRFIPAPSVGTYPGRWYMNTLRVLEELALQFYKKGFILRDGYQRRSVAFMLERIHSYMLLNEIKNSPNPIQVGTMLVISDASTLQVGS